MKKNIRGTRKKNEFYPKNYPKTPVESTRNDQINDEPFNFRAPAGVFGEFLG